MEFRHERRGLSKLEYFLIVVLIVILLWAAWTMLEPLIWPAVDSFLETTLHGGTVTPTPTATPAP